MITRETAEGILEQERNLANIWDLKRLAKKDETILLTAVEEGVGREEKVFSIQPPSELLIPFLDECKAYFNVLKEGHNRKAKDELGDIEALKMPRRARRKKGGDGQ